MTTTTSYRPRDGAPLQSVTDTTPAEINAAVALAGTAAPALRELPPTTRQGWLYALADTLEAHSAELVELADAETALGSARLSGEVLRTAGQLRFYADVAVEGSYLGVTIDDATPTSPRLVRINRPIGPVAVFGASNFPFAFSVLGNDTASALAAGCPIVAKAHPAHVGLSVRLAELTEQTLVYHGAPPGPFALVIGQQAGVDLVRADGIEAVAFTGSQTGGLALRAVAEQRPRVIPVYAEMGTVNPVVITRGGAARLVDVASGFVGSLTLGFGQFCTKPGLVLVPAGHDGARVLGEALMASAPQPVMLTRAIAEAVDTALGQLVAAGASVICTVPGPEAGWSAPAAVLSAPLAALVQGSRLLDECFGAVALVVEYADNDELRRALAVLQGSLTGTVIAASPEAASPEAVSPAAADLAAKDPDATDPDAGWIVEELSRTAGRVTVGDWPTGVAYTWAQQHGGPWPATSDAQATSVGAAALNRFVRPVAYQSAPDAWLPAAGRSDNPWGLPRRLNGLLHVGSAH
jgi:NADP-dependent aldehyde dehydrogenase